MTSPEPFTVIVHAFASAAQSGGYLCAYERGRTPSRNALLYIGGLTSGPHTALALPNTLSTALVDSGLEYSVWEFRMRSSYTGWGHSSLANDAEDIATLVNYLRRLGKNRIVLLGSSTGCQDCMEYIKMFAHSASEVDGYILQAPTSDRVTAGMLMLPEFYQRSLSHTKDQIARGKQDSIVPRDLLPDIFTSPISAYRWHSLIAKGGDDDYFSPDLDDGSLAMTFGKINKSILIMPSEEDEMVPPTVDKAALLRRWCQASPAGVVSPLSNVVPSADHTLSASGSQRWFADRVVQFLKSLDDVQAQEHFKLV